MNKGQFFAVALVMMFSTLIGIAYYFSETTQTSLGHALGYKLTERANSIENSLRSSLKDYAYTRDKSLIDETADKLAAEAEKDGFNASISCESEQTDAENSKYNYTLDCNISLSSGDDTINKTLKAKYILTFEIYYFNDSTFSTPTRVFQKGQKPYYMVTGNVSSEVDLYFYNNTGDIYNTATANLSNVNWDTGQFNKSLDKKGTWKVKGNTSQDETEKTFKVGPRDISLNITDESGTERTTFVEGETVNYSINVEDWYNEAVDTEVKAGVRDPSEKQEDYGSEGLTGSDGEYNNSFTFKNNEILGNWTLTATEHDYYTSIARKIELINPYLEWIKIIPLPYNANYSNVYNQSQETCGYTEWYDSNETTHTQNKEVPFYVVNSSTQESTVQVDNSTVVIDSPQVHAKNAYYIAARCKGC